MLSPAVVPPPAGRADAHPTAAPPLPAATVSPAAADTVRPADGPLPDVAVSTAPGVRGRLDRVGMSGVQAVAAVTVDGRPALLPALCDLAVSLDDPHSRGIHMSRLYLRAQDALEQGLAPARLARLVEEMVQSHAGVSEGAFCDVSLTLPVRQPSLVSGESGWRHYPVRCGAALTRAGLTLTASVRVEYSSTCPCSAALSRDLTDEAFREAFGTTGEVSAEAVRAWLAKPGSIAGHPHSQRSLADVTVTLDAAAASFGWQDLIEASEAALGTATQGAVKRADEREFARLNAANPMFCEDAARRLAPAVVGLADVRSYEISVRHLESLHPHDAVASVRGEANRDAAA
ncbi:GTP cyclohydrolase FolE2 [Alienimonas californiensis]|uniref:GTP cyclohydrolase FolE2 n=1 Tax=Alienimonas californiensis TaxID=2527989 RepID=A0A517PCC7_9PLAN|nr:GTP cyclohydrolase FolE2 [Alienimonas californiensis]QDT17034.1 GTP cyclohydrolase FolE2 [Alienimonas californiensis]